MNSIDHRMALGDALNAPHRVSSGAGPRVAAALRRYARCALIGFGLLSAPHVYAEQLDGIVAIVDDDVVLASELMSRVRMIQQQMQSAGREPPPNDVLINQLLERLIVESIQLQMGARAGVKVPDEMLTQTINGIAEQNEMTREQFLAALQKDNIAYGEFREQVRRELIISRVQQARVNPRVYVSEQEVDNWLTSEMGRTLTADDYRISHILLSVSDQSPNAAAIAESTANSLYERLQKGEDFCQLSAAYSAASQALECGDLGWRKAAQLPSLFVDKVVGQAAGAIIAPIRSSGGFHIVKVMEKRGAAADVTETKVRHILVRPSEIRSDADAQARINDVYARLENGEDFCKVAENFSEDPGSALLCGDMGFSRPEQFVPEFSAVMAQTPIGGRSKPFRTQYGWHVLEVQEQRSRDMTEDNRKEMAVRYLRGRRYEEELENWLSQAREDAFVDIKIGKQRAAAGTDAG